MPSKSEEKSKSTKEYKLIIAATNETIRCSDGEEVNLGTMGLKTCLAVCIRGKKW